MNLFSGTFNTLNSALNYASLKQKVISQNIANVDTPNYKAQDVSFNTIFQNELGQGMSAIKTDKRHFDFSNDSSQPEIITRQNVQYNNNGNSVDMDQEMSDLATNQIYYDALVQQLNSKFSNLQTVIMGGK